MSFKKADIILIVFLLIIWPLVSYQTGNESQVSRGVVIKDLSLLVYLPTIVVQWLLFALIVLILKKNQEKLKEFGWINFGRKNFLIGIGFLIFSNLFLVGLATLIHLFYPIQQKDLTFLLPKNLTDRIFWLVMSLTASVCEEVSFRGYLVNKLNTIFKNVWIASVISSLAFASAHFYQGWVGVVLTGTYGFLFCLLYLWRKSLVPGMTAHFIQNASAMWINWKV